MDEIESTLNAVSKQADAVEADLGRLEAERQKIASDKRLSPEAIRADQAALEERYNAQIEDSVGKLQAQLESVDEALGLRQAQVEAAGRPSLAGPQEWQEAAARAAFVREDLPRLAAQPRAGAMAREMKAVHAKGDKVGLWLLVRYAGEIDPEQVHFHHEVSDTLRTLFPVDEKSLAALKQLEARSAELSMRTHGLFSPAQRRELLAVYGFQRDPAVR